MKIKVLRSIANSLCQMCCSARINTSLERIAGLPDGTLKIDLLLGSCVHSTAGDLQVPMVEDFRAWLSSQMEQSRLSFDVFRSVLLSLQYKTDRVPTDRKRILLFELESASQFVLANQVIEGHATNVLWYQREAG